MLKMNDGVKNTPGGLSRSPATERGWGAWRGAPHRAGGGCCRVIDVNESEQSNTPVFGVPGGETPIEEKIHFIKWVEHLLNFMKTINPEDPPPQ